MSSTDKRQEALVGRFFKEHLVPTAERLRERGVSFFPLGPDPNLPTYFERRTGRSDYVFELDADEFERQLDELWSADEQAAAELRPLVAPLAKLARELEQRENESAQVAPFIYPMF